MPDQRPKRGRLKRVKRILATAGMAASGVFGVPMVADAIRAVVTESNVIDEVGLPPLPDTSDPEALKSWLVVVALMVVITYARNQIRPKDEDDAEQLAKYGLTPDMLAKLRVLAAAEKEAKNDDD